MNQDELKRFYNRMWFLVVLGAGLMGAGLITHWTYPDATVYARVLVGLGTFVCVWGYASIVVRERRELRRIRDGDEDPPEQIDPRNNHRGNDDQA